MKIYYYSPDNPLLNDEDFVAEFYEQKANPKIKEFADRVFTLEEFEYAFNCEEINDLGMMKIFND